MENGAAGASHHEQLLGYNFEADWEENVKPSNPVRI